MLRCAWTSCLLVRYASCKSRGKNGDLLSAHLTFLCPKLRACLVKSCFTDIVDMWFVHIHYEALACVIMLVLSVESERLCSLIGPEWVSVWEQSVRPLTIIHHNNVCNAKINEGHTEHLVMVIRHCWWVSLPTHKKSTKNFILILAQLIWTAFMLTSNHYAPVI